ncbi:MAG TPA: ABC transporter permease [Chloroflexota bacterium]|jgi:peptide/nickel transport system permease protein|nr:ABC transporter permease [Chloroflexota bacterium]
MRLQFILRRLIATAALMFAVVLFVFVFMRYIPGDPVDLILGREGSVTDEQIRLLRAQYRLDEPLWVQVTSFVGGVLRGDLGTSIVRNRPVAGLILERFPATIELAAGGLAFALLVALPVGITSALRQRSAVDRLAMASSFVGMSMPPFWLGIVLIMVFSVGLRWFPVAGRTAYGFEPTHTTGLYLFDAIWSRDPEAFREALRHLILPSVTLGAVMAALIARVMRSSMIEVLHEDYVRTARAKGLQEAVVVLRHALRNAIIPTLTLIGLELGVLLGGNMIVETVFEWPGIGRLVVEAIFARDYPLVQGVVMVYALTFALANLLVDVLYTILNPRITT